MQVRKQQWELYMEQQADFKQEKEYVKAVYCHSAYLTYMQSTSWKTLGWKKHKLESRFLGEISMEYCSAIEKNTFEPVLMRWMKLESIVHSEVSHKEKQQYSILMHIYGI